MQRDDLFLRKIELFCKNLLPSGAFYDKLIEL